MKTEFVRARVEPELKSTVDNILSELGLNATQAITLFYKQIALRHGLPFAVELPNETTLKTLNSPQKSFQQGWKETLAGETQPIETLWDGLEHD